MFPARPDPSTDNDSPRRLYVTVASSAAVLAGVLVAILCWSAAAGTGAWPIIALQAALIVAAVMATAGYVACVFHKYLQDRRRVEIALRESEEKFRGLYEMSSDAVMLLDEDRYLDCNESTLQVFRVRTKEEFCRLHPAKLSPSTQPGGHDSEELAVQRIRKAMRDGSQRFEWIHQRADGELFPTEVVLSPAHFEGRLVLQALVRDQTQRKRAEERLRANEEKLRTISEAALDAVIMMDSAGRAVHWNPAAERMFGYMAEEVLGRNIHELLTPARLHDQAAQAISSFVRTGQGPAVGRILELPAVRKDGQEFPIEISLAPIRVEGVWNAVAVVRDITERKQAEQALRHEQHSLQRLLRAHDQERKLIAYEIHDGLAQQLVAAIYECQTAQRNAHNLPDKTAVALGGLFQLLRRCLAETRRLISGVRPPILDEFGVVTAVQGLIEDTSSAGGPHIEFHHDVQTQRLEPVLENTIYRVIQEGLSNACRHSHSSQVRIELTETDQDVEIRVQDDGVGFDLEKVDKKRFGLAGIRERARLLRGRVTLQSAPGKGTTLEVRLPKDVGELADSV